MSVTKYRHHIDTIKGEDYVLHKDYTELMENLEQEIERLNNIINIKSDFIIDLLETIYLSDDTILHTKAHLIGEEYEDKLKELKEK